MDCTSTNACHMHMPIGTVYFKVGVLSKTLPYMIKSLLTNIPIKCWIVDSNVNRLLNSPGQAMVLPPNDVKVVRCGVVYSLGAVCMDGRGFFEVFPVPFPQRPGCFTYVLLVAGKFPTMIHVNRSTHLIHGVLVLGLD